MSCSSDSLTTGVTCTFTCDSPQYRPEEGGDQVVRTCMKGGVWDVEESPRCISESSSRVHVYCVRVCVVDKGRATFAATGGDFNLSIAIKKF